MTLPPVFIDTAALIAIASAADALHGKAMHVRRTLSASQRRIVTSQWVLAEFLGGLSRGSTRSIALRVVDSLTASARTTVVPASGEGWLAALSLYRSRPDKDWSFVDCSSMLCCQERGIREVFTADRHFSQAGFEVLL